MSYPQYVKTGICEKYQTLLEECERALAVWNEHRDKVTQTRVVSKEAGDELLRLQAKYARAYNALYNHANNCFFCRLVARLEGRNSENVSDAIQNSARHR